MKQTPVFKLKNEIISLDDFKQLNGYERERLSYNCHHIECCNCIFDTGDDRLFNCTIHFTNLNIPNLKIDEYNESKKT